MVENKEQVELKDEELEKVNGGENISFLNEFFVGLYFTNGIEYLLSREYMCPIDGDRIISFDSYSSSDLTNYIGIVNYTWNQLFQSGFEYYENKSNPNYKPR